MNRNLSVLVAFAVLIAIYFTLEKENNNLGGKDSYKNVPWEIHFLADGKMEVLGITLGKTRLGQVREFLDREFELGLYVKEEKRATLEAYFSSIRLAGLSAKMILELDIHNQPWQRWVASAAKAKSIPGHEIKYSLSSEDFRDALDLAVRKIVYIPTSNLDEEVINKRFGIPYQTIKVSDTVRYFMYPHKGLAIRIDDKGKEMLRYIHPDNFDELRQSVQQEVDEIREKQQKPKV